MMIAFVGTFGRESVNGVEYASLLLAKALLRSHHQIFFYYTSGKSDFFTDEHGMVHRVFKRSYNKLLPPKELNECIIENIDRIDLYHLHSVFIPLNYYVSKLVQKIRIPYVLTPHGGYMKKALKHTLRNLSLLKIMYIYLWEKQVVKDAKALVATTDLEVADFRNFGYKGKIVVIPNSIPADIDKEYFIRKISPTIIFLGRFEIRFKGILFLLETFRLIQQSHPEMKLSLYGAGKDEKKIKALVKKSKLKKVEINPPVFGNDKLRVMSQCTLYFQPSSWESFGMSIAEAMVLGKPVAVTSSCYISSMLKEENAGLIVPPDPVKASELIATYLNNDYKMMADGARLREIALARFSPEKVLKETVALYEDVLNKHCQTAKVTESRKKLKKRDSSIFFF